MKIVIEQIQNAWKLEVYENNKLIKSTIFPLINILATLLAFLDIDPKELCDCDQCITK